MKCISACGYSHKPDNLILLTRHIEDCMANGYCKVLTEDPQVIWQDGEFTVVPCLSASKDDVNPTVFEIKLIKKTPIELAPNQIKTSGETAAGAIRGTNSSVTVSKKPTPQGRQIPVGQEYGLT